MLPDGTYDAIVFDATVSDGDSDGDANAIVVVELTVLAGGHKGEVVSVRATGWSGDPLDLLGLPATITVSGGEPSVVFEP